jgi:hypothetical protein
LVSQFPEVTKRLEKYLSTVHEPHPWYWNPGDTQADFNKKKALAKETNQVFKVYRPNGIAKMPWEQ